MWGEVRGLENGKYRETNFCASKETQSSFGGAQKAKALPQDVRTPHPGERASGRSKHTGLGFAEGIPAWDGRVRRRGLCFC